MQQRTLTKLEIAANLALKCDIKKKLALELVSATLEEMSNFLVNNTNLKLNNFGNFKLRNKAVRYAQNPKTGQKVLIPERTVVVFKANKILTQKINANLI